MCLQAIPRPVPPIPFPTEPLLLANRLDATETDAIGAAIQCQLAAEASGDQLWEARFRAARKILAERYLVRRGE